MPAASVFGLLLTAILTQYFDITIGLSFASEHTLALPCIWTFLVILLVLGAKLIGDGWAGLGN